ncbi:hypothetical protein PX554_22685 [Sphingomonas sp. H39-1-10]|uniref:hypothetical protein n=1 Tax=Sphingomonas pollutisoli TaxID=3030829 RepID=UPI0023B939E5|nr:hypothetical protein [Sphingomonas pollutisoli]MDF0490937.1 hypothetical protein [Sphingomonas pollutisoli]
MQLNRLLLILTALLMPSYAGAQPAQPRAGAALDTRRVEPFGTRASIAEFGDTSTFSTWRAAAVWMNSGAPKTLIIPRGIHHIRRAAEDDPLSSLLVFTNNPTIFFESGAVLAFDDLRAPLLTFSGCTGGGIMGKPVFRFTGDTPRPGRSLLSAFFAVSGIPKGLSFGGGYELWSIILSNSDNMFFSDIDARPESLDQAHIIPFVLNLKPRAATIRASGNKIQNLSIGGYQHGVLFYGQQGLRIDGVKSDYRGGVNYIAPGHVIYSTGENLRAVRSRDVIIRRIEDGSHVLGWPASRKVSLGTLSMKGIENSIVEKVRSLHPAGLITSISDNYHNTFQDLCWISNDREPIVGAAIFIISTAIDNSYRRIYMSASSKNARILSTGTGDSSGSVFDQIYLSGLSAPSYGNSGSFIDLFGSGVRKKDIIIHSVGATKAAEQMQAFSVRSHNIEYSNSMEKDTGAVKFARGATGGLRPSWNNVCSGVF